MTKDDSKTGKLEQVTEGMSWGFGRDRDGNLAIDHIFMLQMSTTVTFRCPRCEYETNALPDSRIPCPACYGHDYFVTQKANPRELNPQKSGSGPSAIPFHRSKEDPSDGQ